MQRTGHLPPFLPYIPRSSSVCLLVALERPRLKSLTLKPLKRSHSRPCSLRWACRSKITFETRAHGLLTLLRREDNSVPLGLKGFIPAKGIPLDSFWDRQILECVLLRCQENLSWVTFSFLVDLSVLTRELKNNKDIRVLQIFCRHQWKSIYNTEKKGKKMVRATSLHVTPAARCRNLSDILIAENRSCLSIGQLHRYFITARAKIAS